MTATVAKRKKKSVRKSPEATATTPPRRKKKKKRRADAVAEAKAQQENITPAERIRNVSRGFRLSFGGLPTQKKLTDEQRSLVNKEDVDKVAEAQRMLTQAAKLFDKHPAITALNSAKGAVEALFIAKTLPFPEPGVRILILKTDHLDFEKMTTEEIEKDFARQLEEFAAEINAALTNYDAKVRELQLKWPEVLQVAKDALDKVKKGLFNPANYPTAEQLPARLGHAFIPSSIEPPKEYAHVDPVERQRVLQAIEAQFKEACEKQADFVVAMLGNAIDQMIKSLTGYHEDRQTRFANSVIENVFKAFAEFKEKTIKYGILRGDALEAEFNRAIEFMTDGQLNAETLPIALRKDGQKRQSLIDKMEMVQSSLTNLAEKRKRRRVIRD